MESNGRRKNSSDRQQFKRYSPLTAQFIRSGVKKKIFDIRRRGDVAADELIDMLEKKLVKKQEEIEKEPANHKDPAVSDVRKGSSSGESDGNEAIYNEIAATIAEGISLADKLRSGGLPTEMRLDELLLRVIRNDRAAWRSFICRLASEYDAEALSVWGTNLIYGGFMTEVAANEPRCNYIELSDNRSNMSLNRLSEIIKRDIGKGRRVCILRGRGLLCGDLVRIYRYFGDVAFILIDKELPNKVERGAYNVLYITENGNCVPDTKGAPLCGLIRFEREVESAEKREIQINPSPGRIGGPKLSFGGASAMGRMGRLFYFLSSPSLPLRTDLTEFYDILCRAEALISGNSSAEPAKYTI